MTSASSPLPGVSPDPAGAEAQTTASPDRRPQPGPGTGRAPSGVAGAIAARVAEALTAPLTNLWARLELMQLEAGDRGEHGERLDDLRLLRRNARRLTHVVEALRGYSGDEAPGMRPLRLNEIAARAHASADVPGVPLALDPRDPLILGDAAPLESFVARLLAAACPMTREAPDVRVETRAAEGESPRVALAISGGTDLPDIDLPEIDESSSALLAAHAAALGVRQIEGRAALVLTFPRLTLLLPPLAHGEARAEGAAGEDGPRARAEAVRQAARALRETFDVSELAGRVPAAVLPVLHARSSVAWLRQRDGSLVCVGVAGPEPEGPKVGDALPAGVGLVGQAVAQRRAVQVVDVSWGAGRAGDGAAPETGGAGCSVLLAVPLVANDGVVGALVTRHAGPADIGQPDIDLVQAFAEEIAPAMRDAQRFAREQAAREGAEEAHRVKDDSLAMLSHELRTPIAAIAAASSVLERLHQHDARSARVCSVISRQTSHVCNIVDDLLDTRRLTTGHLRLHRRPLDLGLVARQCLETLELAGRTGQHVLTCQADPVWIDADATLIEQLVNNLVVNALKYTPPGGRITVSVSAAGPDALFEVVDSGMGIAEQDLPRIFDLFFQADRGREQGRGGGFGIGLTLVKRIAELHGGRISAASAGIDRGSSFSVHLPRVVAPAVDLGGARPGVVEGTQGAAAPVR